MSTVDVINTSSFTDGIGYAVFAYEGIGVILPIQDVSNDPKNYWKIVVAVIFTVWASYCVFGMFCCFAWGTEGGMHMNGDVDGEDVRGI